MDGFVVVCIRQSPRDATESEIEVSRVVQSLITPRNEKSDSTISVRLHSMHSPSMPNVYVTKRPRKNCMYCEDEGECMTACL
jgi:hypothetical protein